MTVIVSREKLPPCDAIPVAATHSWSELRGCASSGKITVEYGGHDHVLCGIHAPMWRRASLAERGRLAKQWGWRHGA